LTHIWGGREGEKKSCARTEAPDLDKKFLLWSVPVLRMSVAGIKVRDNVRKWHFCMRKEGWNRKGKVASSFCTSSIAISMGKWERDIRCSREKFLDIVDDTMTTVMYRCFIISIKANY
jgi:hypothetical protein